MSLRLILNGEAKETEAGTVAALVAELVPSGKGVAVALNGEVVARSSWDTQRLNEGDRVEVLRAIGGG